MDTAKYNLEHPKILLLSQLFYPEEISSGQTLTELCEVLADLGADIEVVCGPLTIVDRKVKTLNYLEYHGIKIKRVFGTRFSKFNFFSKFINQVTYALSTFLYLLFDFSKRPVIVVTNPPFLGIICAILRACGGKPYIYLVFDVYPDTAINLGVFKKNIITYLWDCMNRFILKQASSIVVLGRCMLEVICNKVKKKETIADKIKVIHIWSDDRYIKPLEKKENPFIKKWQLYNKFVVSYSGNMGMFHDMQTIMQTAKELSDYKDILFIFIGEGYQKKWMQEYAASNQLQNCRFYTYAKRDEYRFSLACADVGLVSLKPGQEGLSVPSKTFGILAAGVPVIGILPKNSEIALLIEENNCGLVVCPGDIIGVKNAILKLYLDKGLRENLGKNSRLMIEQKYNLENAAKEYLHLIKNLQY